jgi:hypothetical protein
MTSLVKPQPLFEVVVVVVAVPEEWSDALPAQQGMPFGRGERLMRRPESGARDHLRSVQCCPF